MKSKRIAGLLTVLLLVSFLPTQALRESMPVPESSPNQLFYLQRSKDANTIIYEARLLANHKLDPVKPVDVYWIRYAEKGQREDLSAMQWRMAYGYKHKPASVSDTYDISLHAFEERPLQVTYHQGKPVATMLISGQRASLRKVFVQIDPKPHLIPHVTYVEMFGTSLTTNLPVYERIVPDYQ
ncbi:DUF4833 domain-containing protein [Spirosoma sp. BT702]|uniref:DUF4833 domain-containing protein n=1 Tax=Spirosoma profusum TaxID=2771354 RepID=A0A927ART2_9BACT|nr:DUF4833 domain-containing protein [Spirosoma profusum]MBD2702808.1 DUF4833 domain-containing protein [Spirosoma profusum]